MHESYEKRLGHKADFKVSYKFRSPEEGGRKNVPFQGIRFDFSYENENEEMQYMIWPEFLNKEGSIIQENSVPVPSEGIALMWVALPKKRKIHQAILRIGTKGFFREGPRFVADCEVIEIMGLYENPISK